MTFIKNTEDFKCEFCGFENKGNGFTNHCSKCLYSKHVDIEPGDRLNTCKGLMEPVYVSYTNKVQFVLHKCLRCGFEKKNLLQEGDSVETMIEVQKKGGLSNNV